MKQEAPIIPERLKTIARQLRRNLPASRFKDVTDPRRPQGRIHRLADVRSVLLLGLVAALPTLREVEEQLKDVTHSFGLGGCPSDSTLTRVLRALAPDELLPLIGEQIRAMHRSKQLRFDEKLVISLVAIDGKVLLTGKTPFHEEAQAQGPKGVGPPYVLRALRAMHTSSEVKPILGQRTIPAATSESATFRPFVVDLLREYRRTGLLECITADAAFTNAADLRWVDDEGVGFIAALKGNQPGLLDGAHLFLGTGEQDPPNGWELVSETIDTGRRVTRWFARTGHMSRWHADWRFLCGVWRIRQKSEHAWNVTWENRYFLTNLPWNRPSAGEAVRAVIAHWGNEKQANWTMDVSWREDSGA